MNLVGFKVPLKGWIEFKDERGGHCKEEEKSIIVKEVLMEPLFYQWLHVYQEHKLEQ